MKMYHGTAARFTMKKLRGGPDTAATTRPTCQQKDQR